MRKILFLILAIIFSANIASAAQRYNITSGVYVLQDGNQFTIVDDNQNVCFDLSIEAENQAYNIVCGGDSRTAVNNTLNTVITAAVVGAFSNGGASLIPAVKAEIVKIIYNKGCEYWSRHR